MLQLLATKKGNVYGTPLASNTIPSPVPKGKTNLKVRMHPRDFRKYVSSFSQVGERHNFLCLLTVLPPEI